MAQRLHTSTKFIALALAAVILFCACLSTGAVELSLTQIIHAVTVADDGINRRIILEARLPLAITSLCCGMALSVAGLLLQTTFRNPLAGPSILGVSTGASLGVAILMMGVGGLFAPAAWSETGSRIVILTGAMAGSGAVILLLLAFSKLVKSATMLLIVGIMTGYLASAIVSWLTFFAPAYLVKDFSVWGMGSFMGVTLSKLPLFAILCLSLSAASLLLIKPLDAMLLGDRYAGSLGYNPRNVRTVLLLCSGALTAVATAYCGPVGFIGLAVPHMARMVFATAAHRILLPATITMGAVVGLLCGLLCILPSSIGVLPLGAVTPVVGVPVIIYVIVSRRRLNYFT